ncbi:MAG: hypothetical protein H5U13_09365 [Parvibaculum sp.]|nr:hypothetical protein [Parvibaculum sp.]
MMIPQLLEQKFSSVLPFLEELKKHVSATLGGFADQNNFPFSGRIKTAASLSEKIEMGRYKRFSQIDDLVAFTLIVPNATYEDAVIDFCRSKFDVTNIRSKKETHKAPDIFRFDSTRVVASIPKRPDADLDVPSIFGIKFEIQVRTAFEHAWSVATHELVYKSSAIDWKRIRLAAQLKAISESLDTAVASFDHLAAAVNESPWTQVKDQSDVSEFVISLFEQGTLPSELKPDSISRFSENICTLIKRIRPSLKVSEAIEVLRTELPDKDLLPKSLSLYQLFLGIFSQRGAFEVSGEFSCHVTPELVAIYPQTRAIQGIFMYDE